MVLRKNISSFSKQRFIFFQPRTSFYQNIINVYQILKTFWYSYFSSTLLLNTNNKKPPRNQNINKTLLRTDRDRNMYLCYLLLLSRRTSFCQIHFVSGCSVSWWGKILLRNFFLKIFSFLNNCSKMFDENWKCDFFCREYGW